jgi:peptide chain release factor subunit 3
MPNSVKVEVSAIWCEEEEVEVAICGDNIRMRIKGIEEEDVMPGFVVCSRSKPIKTSTQFEAQIAVYEHKNIICAGYQAVLHLHTAIEEVSIVSLLHLIDKKTGRKSKRPPPFVKQGQKVICRFETSGVICMESFDDYPQLGRFTLRDEGNICFNLI